MLASFHIIESIPLTSQIYEQSKSVIIAPSLFPLRVWFPHSCQCIAIIMSHILLLRLIFIVSIVIASS
jgi:hypothetical protein